MTRFIRAATLSLSLFCGAFMVSCANLTPEQNSALTTVGCTLGNLLLSSVTNVTDLSREVAASVCAQFQAGVITASSVDLGSQELNAHYTIQDVKFEDPVQQAELERIRAALLE